MIAARALALTVALFVLSSCIVAADKDATAQDHAAGYLRGVSASLASKYVAKNGKFRCLDGKQTVPFSAVNDDYCDCADGSDEPGTSACSNGSFHCANELHTPADIPSSRVNDGVCDRECCDGSDEYDGKITCPNKCKEVGETARAAEKEWQNKLATGLRKREELIKRAKAEQSQWATRLTDSEKQLEKARTDLAAARIEQDTAEEHERLAQKQANEFSASKNVSNAIAAVRIKLETVQTEYDTLEDAIATFKESDRNPEAVTALVNSFDRFEEQVHVDDKTHPLTGIVNDLLSIEANLSEETEVTATPESNEGWLSWMKSLWSKEVTPLKQAEQDAEDARNKVAQLEVAERDAQSGIDRIKKLQEQDFGPSYEFYYLNGKCYTYKSQEYTYEMCPFDRATQKSTSGSSTSLGNWKGWSGPEGAAKYTRMQFDGGQTCWNGPQRSIVVTLECGAREEIVGVAEPNKCEYSMRFVTPAACQGSDTGGTSDTDTGDKPEEVAAQREDL